MAETEGHDQVTLRILVDKEKNRVVFAEAKKDFVDVLLSFLTFPLGTIARLVSKDSNLQPVRVGSLSTLYESMENLDTEHFSTYTCKEMLLQPRNSMEAYCRNLKLNIDDTEAIKYFICGNWECSRKNSGSLLSSFKNVKCSCGRLMNQEITSTGMDVSGRGSKGYVQATATFIICNDLNVLPNNLGTSVALLRNLGVEDMDSIQEMTVNVSVKEVLDLLKCSLLSTTPLTDLFLPKKQFQNAIKSQPINMSYSEICEEAAHNARQMNVKVLIRKSNRKVLFAQVEEDFADFLFSFLTFPLGRVVHMLAGSSSLGSIDKLYESIANLSADRYLLSQELKDTLVKPQLAPLFQFNNQILPIDDEACAPKYSCESVCEGNGIYRGNLTAQRGY
ncbi:DUF674 family protein [Quillaja saponaria]|uniref:DUF674 family protein n=1 Tax=Quillaja saponaria TaxID=32244 RepID=A0AAD7L2T9_QUISA|nr:DUF674 family protein [Quillaja saponaria]